MTCRALRKYFILFFHSYRTKRLETPIVAPKPDSNRRPEDRSSFPRPTSHCPPTPVSCLRDSRSRSRRSQATNWPSRNDGHDCALDGVKHRSLRFVPDRDTVKVRPPRHIQPSSSSSVSQYSQLVPVVPVVMRVVPAPGHARSRHCDS